MIFYLSKGTFANEGINFVAVLKFLAGFDNVIVIIIIVPFVVHLSLLLVGTWTLPLGLLRSSLLLCVINLKEARKHQFILLLFPIN